MLSPVSFMRPSCAGSKSRSITEHHAPERAIAVAGTQRGPRRRARARARRRRSARACAPCPTARGTTCRARRSRTPKTDENRRSSCSTSSTEHRSLMPGSEAKSRSSVTHSRSGAWCKRIMREGAEGLDFELNVHASSLGSTSGADPCAQIAAGACCIGRLWQTRWYGGETR